MAAGLSRHPVLSRHWPELSLVLKGSTARGNADRYSDIDLFLVCDEPVQQDIIRGYREAGLSERQDGIFVFFAGPGYDGHYHVESFALIQKFYRERDYLHVWEYQTALPLHDPQQRFATCIDGLNRALFAEPLETLKQAYLDLQLDLDWMRHPLRRGDHASALLHAAKVLRGVAQACYLLDCRPYPPDKWLFHYLGTTRLGKRLRATIKDYADTCSQLGSLAKHRELAEYPLYADGLALINEIGRAIVQEHADVPWIERWYNYV